jgi:hypothetical protein
MIENEQKDTASELDTAGWFNTTEPLSISQLKGKVVVIHLFQMLRPRCELQGVSQLDFPGPCQFAVVVHY